MDNSRQNLKKNTISGLIFKYLERCLAQLVSTIVSIVLARILLPEDYGIIVLITILISICDVFVTYGFGNSLVQKIDTDELDYSTCLISSLILSLIVYLLIFLFAPYIGAYYDMPILINIIRVMGIRLIFAAFNSIQQAYIAKNFLFKKFFLVTASGNLISGVIGIIMALFGFGSWALVAQYLSGSIVNTVIVSIVLRWKPKIGFSFVRLKQILSFGWKILAVGLIDCIFGQLRSLIIAKRYSATDLAYYNKGQQFPQLIVNNINTSIATVLFPSMASLQNEPKQVRNYCRRAIKVSTFLLFPLVVGLAAVAKPFICILLTERWVDSATYLQVLCIYYLFTPINSVNRNVMKSMGRSDLLLKLDFIKKGIQLGLLLIAMRYGPIYIALSAGVSNIFCCLINMFPDKKLIDYHYKQQIMDIIPNMFSALLMGCAVYAILYLDLSVYITLLIQIPLGILIYILIALLFKNESFYYVLSLLKTIKNKQQRI